jgi:hypothetical protein
LDNDPSDLAGFPEIQCKFDQGDRHTVLTPFTSTTEMWNVQAYPDIFISPCPFFLGEADQTKNMSRFTSSDGEYRESPN